ncbi:hypothetical protein SEA_ALAKAZAM_3 [Microbacterium phage Alakazam]|nr:hypothetical protein SEA_ALAKAZAM_3 [Microbacterium phage Alakazam]
MDYPVLNYTLFGPEGEPLAGDNVLSSFMKERCDEVGGTIQDKSGTTVYPKEG